jgi:hypothetical protein
MTIGEKVSYFETSHDILTEKQPVLYEIFPVYIGMRYVIVENESHEVIAVLQGLVNSLKQVNSMTLVRD